MKAPDSGAGLAYSLGPGLPQLGEERSAGEGGVWQGLYTVSCFQFLLYLLSGR